MSRNTKLKIFFVILYRKMKIQITKYMKSKFIFIIAIILLLPILGYILFFYDLPLGGPSEWGKFGDFYSGILNPVITAITTLLLINITLLIAKRDETRQGERFFFEYRLNVINKLMIYQQNLNNIRSQFWVKKVLIDAQICKNKDDFYRLSFDDKHTSQTDKIQRDIKNEIECSIKNFLADVLYGVSEIKSYFENFENNHTILFENNFVKKENYIEIFSELNTLEIFLKNCIGNTNLKIPENIITIEGKLSLLITLLSNNRKINV